MKNTIVPALGAIIIASISCDSINPEYDISIYSIEYRDGIKFLQLDGYPSLTDEEMIYLARTKDYYLSTIGCSPTLTPELVVIPYSGNSRIVSEIVGSTSPLIDIQGVQIMSDELTKLSPKLLKQLKDKSVLKPNQLTPIVFVNIENYQESGNHEIAHAMCDQDRRVVYEGTVYTSNGIIEGEEVSIVLSKDPTFQIRHDDGGLTTITTTIEIRAMLLEVMRGKQVDTNLDFSQIPIISSKDLPSASESPYSKAFNILLTELNSIGVPISDSILIDIFVKNLTRYGSTGIGQIAQDINSLYPNSNILEIFESVIKALVKGQMYIVDSD